MKKRISIALSALALLAVLVGTVLGAGGDAGDPVVSLSYVEKTFGAAMEAEYTAAIHRRLGQAYREQLLAVTDAVAAERLSALRAAAGTPQKAAGRIVCRQGDVLTLSPGCKATLLSGTAEADTSYLIDATHGRGVSKSSYLARGNLYMMGDTDSGELRIRSAACELTLDGVYRLSPGSGVDYGALAEALRGMGLFRGTSTGFSLESGASRAQGLVMFLRLLGLEDEALAYTGSAPFTDVPSTHWAYRYVAYAHAQGLTSGTSATRFSPDSPITCQHYATFLLRALHYREGTDFSYDSAASDLVSLGLFTQAEAAALGGGTFYRYKMAYLSFYALYGVDQSSGSLLMNRLTAAGAVEKSAMADGICRAVGPRIS